MSERLSYAKASPDAYNAMLGLERFVRSCGLEPSLLELIKTRASQMNGCAYCIDMHTRDARALGETEQRLYALSAWRETPFYTPRERAALEWTEALTRIGDHGVSDDLYQRARAQFDESELVNLSLAIVTINGWNRLAISFGTLAGSYTPPKQTTSA